jgi:hypothetical protein
MIATLRLTLGLTLLSSALAFAQISEEVTDARQQQLLNEGLRSASVRNTRAVIQEDAGAPSQLALKEEKRTKFRVGLLQDFLYESNANLEGNSGEGSFSYNPSVFFRTETKLNDQFRVDSAITWSSTWYSDLEDRDFWGLSGRVNLNYRPYEKWPEFYAGPELNRFEAWKDGDEISKTVALVAGLRNNLRLASATSLFYDVRYSHRWIDPSQLERDQVNLLVGLTQRLTQSLFLQTSYSFGWFNYEDPFDNAQVDREDLRHKIALALIYRLNENFYFRLSGSFEDQDSTLPRANYQNFSTGLNSGISYEF